MAFFLIGKGPEDDVRVLSSTLFASRQDAMAELSRLSADPAFPHWDADVLVVDMNAAMPVLLVRPQVAEAAPVAPIAPAASVSAEEGVADAWIADIPAEAPVAAVAAVAAGAVAAAAAGAGVVAEADAATESAPEADAEPGIEEVAAAWSVPEEHDELREAILRTTQHMSAEGIVPPPSAGLADGEATLDEAPTAPEAAADDSASAIEAPAEVDGGADEVAPDAATLEAAFGAFTAPSEGESAAPAWPWAAADAGDAPDADVSDVYEALAEPTAPIEDSAPATESADPALGETEPAYGDLVEPVVDAHEPMSSHSAEPTDTPTPTADDLAADSDFILDLDTIAPSGIDADAAGDTQVAVADAEPVEADLPEIAADADEMPLGNEVDDATTAEAEPESTSPDEQPLISSPLIDYVCDDCVYVATCPNRDQRLPKDCGSFQWK
jgi:hypothetical protein